MTNFLTRLVSRVAGQPQPQLQPRVNPRYSSSSTAPTPSTALALEQTEEVELADAPRRPDVQPHSSSPVLANTQGSVTGQQENRIDPWRGRQPEHQTLATQSMAQKGALDRQEVIAPSAAALTAHQTDSFITPTIPASRQERSANSEPRNPASASDFFSVPARLASSWQQHSGSASANATGLSPSAGVVEPKISESPRNTSATIPLGRHRNSTNVSDTAMQTPHQLRSAASANVPSVQPAEADAAVPASTPAPTPVLTLATALTPDETNAELLSLAPVVSSSVPKSPLSAKISGAPTVAPTTFPAVPMQTAAPLRQSASASVPIRINIGRIDVRAATPPLPVSPAPVLRTAGPARLSMADYLKQSRGSRP